MQNLVGIGSVVLVAVIAFLILAVVFSRLYRRATKEMAFVRTGMGGQKIIKDGGALVVPVLHEIMHINLTTLKLPLRRQGKDGLITKDRMRVDVTAEFYVRVKPADEMIAAAAQTLGEKTEDPQALTQLIEGKLVDALRAVAARMTLIELHEQRQEFVQNVQEVVSKDIEKNGLELESVSLTGLDQTNKDSLDPNNVFDAEGLRLITLTVETKKKERNDIERETEVAIGKRDLETSQETEALRRERQFVQLDTDREIASRKATTEAETARIESEQRQAAEQARIEAERRIEESNLARQEAIQVREAQRRQAEELARQDAQIAIADRSRAESQAQAEAENARADAVRASEKVKTAQAEEEANREKSITLIGATQEAERSAIGIQVAAKAERQAAEDRAEAVRVEATARSDAEKIGAEGLLARKTAEAEGQRLVNAALNTLSPEQADLRLREAIVQALPAILAEAVKPMEHIDSIRVVDMSGMGGMIGGGGSAVGGDGSTNGSGGMADQVVGAALRHRALSPMVDGLLREVGMDAGSLAGLTGPAMAAFGGSVGKGPAPAKAPAAGGQEAVDTAASADEASGD